MNFNSYAYIFVVAVTPFFFFASHRSVIRGQLTEITPLVKVYNCF